jgi:methionyl-tRNA formyltransferase
LETDLHGAIDWTWSATDIERFICACDEPYPGAYTFVRGRKIRLRDGLPSPTDEPVHPFQAGLVYRIHGGRVYVACSQGNISVGQVVFEDGADAIGSLLPGDRLWTGVDVLERARTTRVIYTSTGLEYQASLVEQAVTGHTFGSR